MIISNEKETALHSLFLKNNITLMWSSDRGNMKKENYSLVSLIGIDAKTLRKILANSTQYFITKVYYVHAEFFSSNKKMCEH